MLGPVTMGLGNGKGSLGCFQGQWDIWGENSTGETENGSFQGENGERLGQTRDFRRQRDIGGENGTTPRARRVSQDAGLVYRGRVLLEICTHSGTPPGRQRDAVAPVDAERAQVGTRGRGRGATPAPPGAG